MPVLSLTDLVERDAAIQCLDEQRSRAAGGSGSTVVFAAPAGLGKSSLLVHGRERAGADGFLVAHARGDELGRTVPHAALLQLVHQLLRGATSDDLLALAASPAAPLVDAVRSGAGTGLPELGRAATGLWWLLDFLGDDEDRPILLAIDDIQWIDGASLAAIAYVANRIDDLPCAIVAAERTGEAPAAPDELARLRHAGATRIEPLAVLTLDGCACVTRSSIGSVDDDVVARAHEASGGNPFLLTELLRHSAQADHRSVPPRIVDHMRLRLQHASPKAATVGAASAVLGPWATIARIATVADLPVELTETVLDELVTAGVASREQERCRFRHPLLREALLATALDDADRRRLARRAADAAIADGLAPTAIASLLLDAPIAGDPDTARRLVDGARSAIDSGARREAITFLERALAEPILDIPARVEASLLLMRAHMLDENKPAALEAAVAALEQTTDPHERSDLRITIANLRIGTGDVAGAMRDFAAATTELADVPGTAARMAMLRAGERSFGRFIGGGTGDDPLLRALTDEPDTLTLETRILLANLGLAHVIGNRDAAQACAYARRALGGTALLDDVTPDAQILYVAMAPLGWCEDFDAAFPAFDAAVSEAQRRGAPIGFAMASASRGGAHLRRGDLNRAAADLDAAIEGRHDGWSAYLPMNGNMAARVHEELGNDAAVRATVEACVPAAAAAPWGALEPFAWDCLAVAARSRGEDDRALELWRAALTAAERHRQRAITLSHWRHCAVELAARLGHGNEFGDVAAESLTLARGLGAPRALGLALRASAAIERDDDARLRLLDEAVEVLEAGDVRLELARTLVRRAELVGVSTRRDELVRALQIAAACGARRLVEEIAALGVVAPDDRAHELLTPAELRVAELAASGRTNREIAAALFVTVKAVEWHLSNCYRKLEIRGRRELATALAAAS